MSLRICIVAFGEIGHIRIDAIIPNGMNKEAGKIVHQLIHFLERNGYIIKTLNLEGD